MNNHCVVPNFEMNDDYPNIPSAIFTTSKKFAIADDEIMELIWQNGQVIVQNQSQNQRCMKKSYLFSEQPAIEESVAASAPLFIQDDEMNSWLQSPFDAAADDDSFAVDFLYTPPPCSAAPLEEIHTSTAEIRPPPPQMAAEIIASSSPTTIVPYMLQNFLCTTRDCAAVTSAAATAEEIHTSTAEQGELTHRLQNFRYTTPNCAAVTSSAVAPPGEIDTLKAEIRPPPPKPPVETIVSLSPRLIKPELRCTEGELTQRLRNFRHFSADEAILRNCTSSSGHSVKASTVVESNETPTAAMPEYVTSVSSAEVTAAVSDGREVTTSCELTMTLSTTNGSGGTVSAIAEPPVHPSHKEEHAAAEAAAATETAEERKRKIRESEDNEGQSEDVEFESSDVKKQVRSSTSAKKSRAAEVHNLSERKRRDRINEKMRALQELIPRCNKSDKASMLDEAIEYLKSLQLQVQMMSTGCNMVPMMYPGIPQYMPTMGMNMGTGMSMEMGMNRPMVPYPLLMPGTAMRNAAAAAQMAPRYPLPAYHLPPFPAPDPSRIPVANQTDPPRLNSLVGRNTNQPRLPNFGDPYHQYFGLQQAQLMFPQNQGVELPSSNKPNTCIEGSAGNRQSG